MHEIGKSTWTKYLVNRIILSILFCRETHKFNKEEIGTVQAGAAHWINYAWKGRRKCKNLVPLPFPNC
jgi:hypothetical protein